MPHPYALLFKDGIHPGLSIRDITDWPNTTNLNQIDLRVAWDEVRIAKERLFVDFFVYGWSNRHRLEAFKRKLANGQTVDWRELGDDSGIPLLLAGDREQVRTLWEGAFWRDPNNALLAHRLALLYTCEAQHAGSPEAWRSAMAYWVRTLRDDQYWKQWWRNRQECYGDRNVDSAEVVQAEVRGKLYQWFVAELRKRKLADLEPWYEAEWRGAQVLRECGGLPVGRRNFVCGRLMLEALGKRKDLDQLIQRHRERLESYRALPAIEAISTSDPVVSSQLLHRLQLYFSPLATAVALLERQSGEEALEAFQAAGKMPAELAGCAKWLEAEIYLAIAVSNLSASPPSTQAAELALREAFRTGGPEMPLRFRDLGLGRATSIAGMSDDLADKGQRLNEAIGVVETVYAVLPEDAEDCRAGICEELASLLDLRGCYCLRKLFIYKSAYEDLKRAFDLYPDSEEYCGDFCDCLLDWAEDALDDGDRERARKLMERALNLANSLLGTRRESPLQERVRRAEEALAKLDPKPDGKPTQVDPQGIEGWLQRAEDLLKGGDIAGAAGALNQVTAAGLTGELQEKWARLRRQIADDAGWLQRAEDLLMKGDVAGAAGALNQVTAAGLMGELQEKRARLRRQIALAKELVDAEGSLD